MGLEDRIRASISKDKLRWYSSAFNSLAKEELQMAFNELEQCRDSGVLPDGIVRRVHAVLRELGLFTSAATMMDRDFYYEISRRVINGEW